MVATDQEGGIVKRFIDGPPQRAPSNSALDGDGGDAQLEGKATGTFLDGIGINTDLAPVLDVPATGDAVIAGRAFGDDAARVSNLGLALRHRPRARAASLRRPSTSRASAAR